MQNLKSQLKNNKVTYLRIKANPNAKKTLIKQILTDNTYKIDISASPKDQKANNKLIHFLALNLDIPKTNVIILNGKNSKIKLIKLINNKIH